jgi:hypothetical protein
MPTDEEYPMRGDQDLYVVASRTRRLGPVRSTTAATGERLLHFGGAGDAKVTE